MLFKRKTPNELHPGYHAAGVVIAETANKEVPILKVKIALNGPNPEKVLDVLLDFIDDYKLFVVGEHQSINSLRVDGQTTEATLYTTYATKDNLTILDCECNELEGELIKVSEVTLNTTDNNILCDFKERMWPFIYVLSPRVVAPPRPMVYLMMLGLAGPELKAYNLETKLTSENYYEEGIVSGIEAAMQKKGAGLLFLNGVAGTGKTNLIRHLTAKTHQKFVFVPQAQLSMLMNPQYATKLITVLTNCVLILEDAEGLFKSRDSNDGAGGITSTLLNLTDGFLGELTNLKVIATQNTMVEIDKAFLRPGRLLYQGTLNELSVERAKLAAKTIGVSEEKIETITAPIILASLFAMKDEVIQEESLVEETEQTSYPPLNQADLKRLIAEVQAEMEEEEFEN